MRTSKQKTMGITKSTKRPKPKGQAENEDLPSSSREHLFYDVTFLLFAPGPAKSIYHGTYFHGKGSHLPRLLKNHGR
jgi:hypothetical protein